MSERDDSDDPNTLSYPEAWMHPSAVRYAERFKREVAPMIRESALYMMISDPSKVDVKYATEVGYALCLGKPLVLVIEKSWRSKVPDKMIKIADAVIEIDEWNNEEIAEQLGRVMKDLEAKGVFGD